MPLSKTKTLDELQTHIGYFFKDIELLKKSLTHGSYYHENKEHCSHNERFEFLGDAILDFVISEILMNTFPLKREGDLSQMRAAIVNQKTLADMASQLNLGEYLYLGRSEEKTNGREKPSILASALEALITAVYKDGGFEEVNLCIQNLFLDIVKKVETEYEAMDSKSKLQQLLQGRFRMVPSYHIVSQEGPDHQKTFEVQLTFQGKELARGKGKNKKEAECQAARLALESIEI